MTHPVAELTRIETVKGVYQEAYRLPTITAYNRLEASPRTTDFTRSLRAEVRDPIWMLTRQWQLGEFQGEDAATPISARILSVQQHVDRVSLSNGPVNPYDDTIPIETRVERERLKNDLGLAVELARAYWKSSKALVSSHRQALVAKYPLTFNPEPNDYAATQLYESAQSRWWNGFAMYVDMTTAGVNPALTRFREWLDGEATINGGDKISLDGLVTALTDWYARMYSQPSSAAENAWKTRQLEYGFTLATSPAQQNVLMADEYYQGHVDWYSVDLDNRQRVLVAGEAVPTTPADEGDLASFIPAPISFKGMPNPRFWQMEENQTDFGAIGASTTALLHLAFAEFGLIYSNDWFMLPFPMPFNSLCEVKGIVITDVFGHETLIRPAGRGTGTNWHRWTMFQNTDRAAVASGAQSSNKLYLASSITQLLEGDPVEKVNFLRDDAAKMVWAVENIVPSLAGPGIRGDEMDIGTAAPVPFVSAGTALIRYVAGTTVPTNWIPFMPVHLAGSDSEIQLQRARLPGAPPARGRILTEVPAPFFINEEEVPRAGVIVSRSWQRARWTDGQTYLWLGRAKEAGRGEGSSELKFDQLEEIKPPEPV
jgi:hypothetical protein